MTKNKRAGKMSDQLEPCRLGIDACSSKNCSCGAVKFTFSDAGGEEVAYALVDVTDLDSIVARLMDIKKDYMRQPDVLARVMSGRQPGQGFHS